MSKPRKGGSVMLTQYEYEVNGHKYQVMLPPGANVAAACQLLDEAPAPPAIKRTGQNEITEPEKRWVAQRALEILWFALDLSNPPIIPLPGSRTREQYDSQLKAYREFGSLILGSDKPEHEVKT